MPSERATKIANEVVGHPIEPWSQLLAGELYLVSPAPGLQEDSGHEIFSDAPLSNATKAVVVNPDSALVEKGAKQGALVIERVT